MGVGEPKEALKDEGDPQLQLQYKSLFQHWARLSEESHLADDLSILRHEDLHWGPVWRPPEYTHWGHLSQAGREERQMSKLCRKFSTASSVTPFSLLKGTDHQ